MILVDITKNNWQKIVSLTTNKDRSHTLEEEHIASNAYSLLQSVYEHGWVVKGIEHNGIMVGFTMYGYCEEVKYYEICRLMIDSKFQSLGYGQQAIKIIMVDMATRYHCDKIYISVDKKNVIGRHICEKVGFEFVKKMWDDEDIYCFNILSK